MRSLKRTRSFEPVWWGSVFDDEISLNAADGNSNGPPVHTLILGTHPSIQSLSRQQYYGHPLNAFWYIAGDCLGFCRSLAVSPSTGKPYAYCQRHLSHEKDDILEYPDQLKRLVQHGFALWDIVGECERPGSLDGDIREEVPNPIGEFCEGGQLKLAGWGDETESSVKRIVIANGTTGASFLARAS